MNQVKEVSRIGKVIEGLRMVFESLAVNDVVNETTLEREANIIRGQENTAKINELEKEIENSHSYRAGKYHPFFFLIFNLLS